MSGSFRRISTALLVALALIPALTAAAAEPGRLRVGMNAPLTSFDIQEVRDVLSSKVLGNVFDGLVGYSTGSTRLEGALALSWSPSNGFATWTFRLRSGVEFSDGTPTTPTLVATSLGRIPNLKTRGAVSADEAGGTVTVKLARPDADFPAQLAQGYWSVTLRKNGKVLGTGPFLLDPASTKSLVVLKVNPKYWGKAPHLSEVTFRSFGSGGAAQTKLREAVAKGEIDLTDQLPPWETKELAGRSDLEIRSVANRGLTMLGFNRKRKPLSDVRVRRAIAHALDRTAAVRALFGSDAEAARAVIPPSILATAPDPWDHDPAKARALLAEAGFPNGFETTILDTFATGGGAPGVPLFSDLFAKDLAAIGIRVKRVPLRTFDEFLSRLAKGDYDLSISGWTADTGSASDWLESNFSSALTGECPACNNTWFLTDPELDRHLAEARARKSPQAYAAILEIVYREVPFVPIIFAPQIGVSSRRVGGYVPAATPTLPLRDVVVR